MQNVYVQDNFNTGKILSQATSNTEHGITYLSKVSTEFSWLKCITIKFQYS